ncbi:MAG: hypothetical protein H7Y22_17450, partial [Gemmatimonadaceae bacterium]|nr:hypothetical protein [Gloeobacterales cyanobacterium ES-bin-141]
MHLSSPGPDSRAMLCCDLLAHTFRSRLALASTALLMSGLCLGTPAQAQTMQGGDVVAASVNLSGSARRIPSSFTGFSIEFTQILAYTGRTPENVNTDFSQLLKNIGQLDNGLPLIRIGGNTAEKVWYNPDGQPMPPGITFDITPTYLEALGASFSHSGAKLLMGLNLAMDDPDFAVELAREAWARIPHDRILAFQISNEANIFPYKTYYTDPSTGKAVPIRPSDWTFDEYISEFNAHKNALYNRVSTSLPLNGPVFSGGSKDDGRWKNY